MTGATSASSGTGTRRVAIACQGGGSHTAFTAGVLMRLFGRPEFAEHEVVGLSGTSGGAICALLSWSALRDGDPARAEQLLGGFWADNSAHAPAGRFLNAWAVWAASTLQRVGLVPGISPYDVPTSGMALDQFRRLLERQVDFDRIDVDRAGEHPVLLIGAVEVLSGRFRAFHSRHDRITADTVFASAAIPNVFRAVHLDDGTYWDGLFSQNPPVRDLLDTEPDELWVIQINPRERAGEPRTLLEIADRRNELSGNLSLFQELGFIEKIDQLIEAGALAPGGKYKQVTVRIIEMPRTRLAQRLGVVSKLNRDPAFLRMLIDHGRQHAERFLAALALERAWLDRDADAVVRLFADDAELVSEVPFPQPGVHRGIEQVRQFVAKHFGDAVRVDLTRKQVLQDAVTWTVRAPADGASAPVQGRAEAVFGPGGVTRLRLGS